MLKKLNKMRVQKRLMTSFILLVLIASISGVVGAVSTLVLDSQYGTALIENGFVQGDVNRLTGYLQKAAALTRDVIFLTDKEDVDAAYEELMQAAKDTETTLEKARVNCTTPAEKEILARFDETLPKYREKRDKVLELGLAGQNDEALALFRAEAKPLLQSLIDDIDELAALNADMGNAASARLTLLGRILLFVIIVIIIVAVVVGVFFAKYITKSFTEPLEQVKEASAKMAKGELDVKLDITSTDEFGEMGAFFQEAVDNFRNYISEISWRLDQIAQGDFSEESVAEFNGDFVEISNAIVRIQDSLNATMKQIQEVSQQVALGSEQLAEGAQALAEGATDQAGAVEELTATVEDITGAVERSAESASEAYEDAGRYVQEAENSRGEMNLLMEAMTKISDTSKEIEKIIAEIEDIASQTNLLSLNASIEAARAGEAGRGFAVVADQIGKLAADSAQSAVNTRTLIANSLEEIELGNKRMETTSAAIENVIVGMGEMAELSKGNVASSHSQSESMKQVEIGIEQISSVIQSNSAAAQENSATSEEMSAQAESLQGLIAQFKLKN